MLVLMLPVEGSNLGLRGQNAVSMPAGPTGIADGGVAPGPGIEPGRTVPKTVVLPLHQPGSWCRTGVGAPRIHALTTGLEPAYRRIDNAVP